VSQSNNKHQIAEEKPLPINDWLQNIPANKEHIIAAIISEDVVLTSKKGFEKIRQTKRDDTKKIFELSGRVGELTAENAVLLNTLVSVLFAFNGVAAKGPEILDLVKAAGIEKGMTGFQFGMKLMSNPGLMKKLVEGGKGVIDAFDPKPLSRIDGEALLPILNNVGFDFSAYNTLITTFAEAQKPTENG